MSISTQCPQCNTRFRITQAQLDARQGTVRCGVCKAVFNATERLRNDTLTAPAEIPSDAPVPLDIPPLPEESVWREPPKEKPHWLWAVGCVLLLLLLTAQLAYFYRIDIAARYPSLKPALTSYCQLLKCDIPLPRHAELMTLDSSSLEIDPAASNIVNLETLLHNHAPYPQAWPDIELTLTDAHGTLMARRAFHPADYLQSGETGEAGLAAGGEFAIKLRMDTADIGAAGYRLLLFYP
ncbi:MAG: zinc-ribbon and DUF3426 domain-containing protein [Gallionellaceae bacterium]|jgi:predicted Zn finger-like uncharacterized protein|nr:zinc-ribbon and DUF3426 domain-containing protein [Gallionellaceae bacterium]